MVNILGLDHIGIYVKDLEVSKRFYCDKLDFTVIHETTFKEDTGIDKIAFLRAGDVTIELIQTPVYKKREDGPVEHIAFKVKDIESTAERLRAKGIVFDTENITFAPNFFDKGDKWIFFRGPDGEHLEINEVL
jgi:lactoylglutathione lyase